LLPLWGILLLAFLINAVANSGFSLGIIPGLVFCLLFIAVPLLNRRGFRKTYANTPSMHGKLSVDVQAHGLHFRGQSFSSEVGWSNFIQFFEDEDSFVIYQNAHVFNLVPKRGLSSDQVTTLRTYLERAIPREH
jgi:hypothetical protein